MLNTAVVADNLSFDRTLNGTQFKGNFSPDALAEIAESIAGKPVWVNHKEATIGTVVKAQCCQMPTPHDLSEADQKIVNRHGGYYCVIGVFQSSNTVSNILKNADVGCSVGQIPSSFEWHGQTLEFNSSRAYELSLVKEGAISRARIIKAGIPEATLDQAIAKLQSVVDAAKPKPKPVRYRWETKTVTVQGCALGGSVQIFG